jgi:hypothetical protein
MRHEGASYDSADEAVRAVRILLEVLRVPARIPASVLREKHAVRVISPPGASESHIIGSETARKVTPSYGSADVLDEPAHETQSGTRDTCHSDLADRRRARSGR